MYNLKKDDRMLEWQKTATENDKQLFDKIGEFEEYFSDMVFDYDSITTRFLKCQYMYNGEWKDGLISLPPELEYFSLDWFWFKVEELNDNKLGCFNCLEQSLTITPKELESNSTILHEMIHLHEYVIDELPLYYHDVVFWCLYKDLSEKISDLDKRIEQHGHILNEQIIYEQGGKHDILFLLKSFDLDLKMNYKLGTVFGYGYSK